MSGNVTRWAFLTLWETAASSKRHVAGGATKLAAVRHLTLFSAP